LRYAMKKNDKTAAERFYDSIVHDPEAIIKWCKSEIKAYEELIAIIENEVKVKSNDTGNL